MPAQALYRKWRPQLWEEVVGQEHVVQTLRNALRGDRIAHAYLFAGPRGCGKTTTARLVAKALNCLHPDPAQRPDNTCAHCVAVNEGRFLDLIEIDGASNNGVENIRELRDKINFAPNEGRYKIYIIDEVHMLSLGAFNALLKTLEEPPAHAIFILATTESYKIPATVSSRCQRFEFRRIPVAEIVARLEKLCEQEHLNVEDTALEVVARQATGSLRDAISLLDQLVAADATVTLAQAQALLGTTTGQAVQDLVDALTARDTTRALDLVNTAVDAGADPRQLARQLVDYLRGLMLVRLGNAALVEATAEVRALMARQAEKWEAGNLLRAIRAFNTAANDVKGGWQPQLPLELAIVECSAPATPPVPEPSFPTTAVPPVSRPTGSTGPLSTRGSRPAPASPPGPATAAVPPVSRPTGSTGPLSTRGSRPAPASPPGPATAQQPAAAARPGETPDLRAIWNRIIATMLERKKVTKLTQTDLEKCSIESLEGNTLRVFTPNKVFFEKFNSRPDVGQLISNLLSEELGFACSLRLQWGESRANQAAEGLDVPADGMVATALRDLGGKIVE
jgi:DNA polymerase-3 subunit gamma/tau